MSFSDQELAPEHGEDLGVEVLGDPALDADRHQPD